MFRRAGIEQNEAEDFAARLHARLEEHRPAHRIEEFASAMGYRVHFVERALLAGPDGASNGRLIFVGACGVRARDVWTLAHEIAHQELGIACAGKASVEDFVDSCVGAWLLPRSHFREFVGNNSLSLHSVSRHFGTSLEATARRFLAVGPGFMAKLDQGRGPFRRTSGEVPPEARRVAEELVMKSHTGQHVENVWVESWAVGAWSSPRRHRSYALAVPYYMAGSPF